MIMIVINQNGNSKRRFTGRRSYNFSKNSVQYFRKGYIFFFLLKRMSETKETIADWSGAEGKLARSALGAVGLMGELYDARTEMFCSRSLFSSSLPRDLIKSQQNPRCEIDYSYSDRLSDKFDLLKVEAELQLSILFGAFTLEGHAEYLKNQKKSERTVSYTLLYKLSTVCEKLLPAFNEIEKYIDKKVFEDDQYTHVVVEINWGANCTVSLEHHVFENEDKTKAEGLLKSALQSLGTSIKPEGRGEYNSAENSKDNSFQLKIYADVLPDGNIPNTVEAAVEFISQVPNLVKKINDGKGKPLNYIMIPISTFKKLFLIESPAVSIMLKSVDKSFAMQLLYFFEKLIEKKRQLNDLQNDFEKNKKYVSSDCSNKIRDMLESVEVNETKLKTNLLKDLPNFRNGKIEMWDLIDKMEEFKSSKLNIARIADFIDGFTDTKSKLKEINLFLSKKIIYLGKDEDLNSLMVTYPNDELLVMYTSKGLKDKNPDLSMKSSIFFESEVKNSKENSKFVIVDFDVNQKIPCKTEQVRIFRYKNGKVLSNDAYKDYEVESSLNFARVVTSSSMKHVPYKPSKRAILELPCPGFRRNTCPKKTLVWTCSNCKDNLEYGFDDHFYCSCGKAESRSYELKCSSLEHGNNYLSVKENFPLKDELDKLRLLKEMNILIMGQSGVGKSTWINGIVNYLHYDTLNDAEIGGVFCAIPSSFTMVYEDAKKGTTEQIVEVGGKDSNEITVIGKSSTQGPKTYSFNLGDRKVRLIDTPGLGDSEGIDKDKENMKKILDHISYLDEIHGICILLKSNEAVINTLFRFCITELLTHLHKSAAKNILFCFTNSRASFYLPGDTSNVLRSLLKDMELDSTITLSKKTMFCLDNEAFRYLCMLQYKNIPQIPEDRKLYEASWEKSVSVTKELFQRITELEPHRVENTTALCKVRYRILSFTKPMAEISKTIQLNLDAIEKEEREIKNSNLSLRELAKRKIIPYLELQPEALTHPRTVCTNTKCVTLHKIKGTDITLAEYTQICHENCRVKEAVTDTYPQTSLRYCQAIRQNFWFFRSGGTTCRVCGCDWQHHMHITYSQKLVEVSKVDTSVEKEIQDAEKLKAEVEKRKKELEERTNKFKAEQQIIMEVSSQFGFFLKQNAIAAYNDAFKGYLKYLIDQEKLKIKENNAKKNQLKNLQDMMQHYEKEVETLENNMKNAKEGKILTPKDIIELEKRLYDLELTGKQFKSNAEMSLGSLANAQKYAEEPLPIKSSLFGRNWFGGLKNNFNILKNAFW